MALSLAEVEQQAKQLNANEQAQLAESLLASLTTSVSTIEAAWAEEIESRVAAFDSGKMKAVTAEQVFAEAKNLSL